jgi:5-methylcytosine-specific restriction endonuclease McrA
VNPRQWGLGDRRRLATRDYPAGVRALVDARQGGRFCVECRALGIVTPPDEPLQLDHKQPLSEGGDNHHLNLQWACRAHNCARGARKLATPRRPTWARRRARRPEEA